MKESATFVNPNHDAAEELSEPDYDVVGNGQQSHNNINMTSNPAYSTVNTIKLEDNHKVIDSDCL